MADCPNACSRPQIQGIGLIGAREPAKGDAPCSGCGACIEACPTGALTEARRGWRVLLGGKLGRHPRLAEELSGLYTEDGVMEQVQNAVSLYKAHSRGGERFSDVYARHGIMR